MKSVLLITAVTLILGFTCLANAGWIVRYDKCPACDGNGVIQRTCRECQGAGKVWTGFIEGKGNTQKECPRCEGKGSMEELCNFCNGKAFFERDEWVDDPIPSYPGHYYVPPFHHGHHHK